VQRIRLCYTKRGRLRFTSHRDFQRAFERALRRAEVPMAYSAGFTPHPKVSYANAAPTGTGSEAEYLEIALTEARDPDKLRELIDASLPPGLDVTEAVEARTPGLAERLTASVWELRLPGVAPADAERAAAAFRAAETVEVQRRTKSGMRTFDARAAVVELTVPGAGTEGPAGSDGPGSAGPGSEAPAAAGEAGGSTGIRPPAGSAGSAGTMGSMAYPGRGLPGSRAPVGPGSSAETVPDRPGDQACAILRLVVRHVTPAVRPDDVLSGLRALADLAPPVPVAVTRLAQGSFDEETGTVTDPLAPDREAVVAAPAGTGAAELAAAQAGGTSQVFQALGEAPEGPA
jgi:radical SAM-linked protein